MIYDKHYFEGKKYGHTTPGGYDAYGATAYSRLSLLAKAVELIEEFNIAGSVLVVGAAYGHLVSALRQLHVNAYGLDISSFAISQSPAYIRDYLFVGNAAEPESYYTVCNKAGIETFSLVISENMFCCLSDDEACLFHILSIFFSHKVVHLVENRPALAKWYNYKSIERLNSIYEHPQVSFKIQE